MKYVSKFYGYSLSFYGFSLAYKILIQCFSLDFGPPHILDLIRANVFFEVVQKIAHQAKDKFLSFKNYCFSF